MSVRTRARHFTQEASDSILSTLGRLTPDQRELAFDALAGIFSGYVRASDSESHMPDIAQHRQQLSSLLAVAKKLKQLLKREPLAIMLLTWHPFVDEYGRVDDFMHTVPEVRERRRKNDVECAILRARFLRTLELMRNQVTRLLSDPAVLREWRESAGEGAEHKSVERRTIWEPMFALWSACEKPVGAARKGKLFNSIAAVHRALGLPPPNEETLYRSILAWKEEGVI